MQVQRGNLVGKSSLRTGTDPLRVFNCLHQRTLWIFIYLRYFLAMKHKNFGNWWGSRNGLVLLQRSWNCTEILLYGWCWRITCNIPGFIFHFFSSSMLPFILLCNQVILWNSASFSLVYLCWNADIVAKLTCVLSWLLHFQFPMAFWKQNPESAVSLPGLLCKTLATSADLLLHLPFLCPVLGSMTILCLASPIIAHSQSALCACQFLLCQNSAVRAELTAGEVFYSTFSWDRSDISIWKLKPCSLFRFCIYFCRLFSVSWAPLKSLRSFQERDNP